MAKDANSYYEAYKKQYGETGYRMQNSAQTSRVRFLVSFIRKYVPKGGSILDVGCGDMTLSRLLPDYDWVGVDIAPDMSQDKAIKQDLMQTPYPFPAARFDAVVCSEVLEHLWNPEIVHAEVKRLLKPDGTYILSTPNFDHLDNHMEAFAQLQYDPDQSHRIEHIRWYTPRIHEQLLARNGLRGVEVVGADAHYSRMFSEARQELLKFLNKDLGVQGMDEYSADMVLGRMFPKLSHTVMVVAKHA